jgi:type IV pilus assembly protein PilB
VVTIEDPIEYAIDSVEQIQVNARTGLTFANGLRSILRQDPNIIMVGEIRDAETAGIAINVSLTGHLLLSTLHTNDPATTLPRLLDMGIESYLVASTVNLVIGQRLVRRICEHCKISKEFTPAEIKSLSEYIPAALLKKYKTFYLGKGCEECNQTGYKGRLALHEVLEIDDSIRELILRKAPANEIRDAALKKGMVAMGLDGLIKASLGLTTIEEILRISHE